MHNKWIKTQTRNIYGKTNPNSNPNEAAYKTLELEFIDNLSANEMEHIFKHVKDLTSEKHKWNYINEARTTNRIATTIPSLKNWFCDLVTDDLQIDNLLKYRFFKLGKCLGECKS